MTAPLEELVSNLSGTARACCIIMALLALETLPVLSCCIYLTAASIIPRVFVYCPT